MRTHKRFFKNVILLLFITLLSVESYSQCAVVDRPDDFVMPRNGSCEDPTDPLPNYNGNITFKVSLWTCDYTEDEIDAIITAVGTVYNPQGIFFQFEKRMGDGCTYTGDSPEVVLADLQAKYPDCFIGVVMKNFEVAEADVGGSLKFASRDFNVPHEIGHALGLLHTFAGGDYNETTPENSTYTNELVTRDEDDENCECNCIYAGDLICDTPATPFKQYGQDLNCTWGVKVNGVWTDEFYDDCTNKYVDYNNEGINNVMSYSDCDTELTYGQARYIRERLNMDPAMQATLIGGGTLPIFSTDNIINTVTTWSSDRSYDDDVFVNNDLVIQSSTIQFSKGHGFILAPGVHFEVDNSTLSDVGVANCLEEGIGALGWNGIKALPGQIGQQTTIVIENNSLIENAEVAIDSEGDNDFTAFIFNSVFDECIVAFRATNPIGSSIMTNVQINKTSSDSAPVIDLESRVFNLWSGSEIKNGSIKCLGGELLISSSLVNVGNDSDIDVSIDASDANVSISNSTIEANHIAVKFISSGMHMFNSTDSHYKSEFRGIDLFNEMGAVDIKGGSVTVTGEKGPDDMNGPAGIYGKDLTNFEISDVKLFRIIGEEDSRGIDLNNSLSEINTYNVVEKNVFTGFTFNIRSNGDYAGDVGLTFLCNIFGDSKKDIICLDHVAKEQGKLDEINESYISAGNKFAYNGAALNDIQYGNGINGLPQMMNYHFNDPTPRERPEKFSVGITRFFGADPVDCSEVSDPPIVFPPTANPKYINSLEGNNAMEIHLTSILDNGSTNFVINEIDTNSPTNTSSVITMLDGLAPNVSSDAIIALLENSEYYYEQEIVDIIIDNPLVLDDNYISYQVLESGSFSAYNVSQIKYAYINHTSIRKDVETAISYYTSVIDKEIRVMNSYTRQHPTDYAFIRSLYQNDNRTLSLIKIIETYIGEKDYSNALSSLSLLNHLTGKGTNQSFEIEKYVNVKNIQIDLAINNRSWDLITTSDYNTLLNIANNQYGIASSCAKSILSIYFDVTIPSTTFDKGYIPIAFKVGQQSKSVSNVGHTMYATSDMTIVEVLQSIDPRAEDQSSLQVIDIMGRKVDIDHAEINIGLYVYIILNSKNEIVQSGKLIVTN